MIKTNKFKVGNLVAAYVIDNMLQPIRLVTRITQVYPNDMIGLDEDDPAVWKPRSHDYTLVHAKWCRRVKLPKVSK